MSELNVVIKRERKGADASKADASKADSSKADSSKADSSKADSSKADASKAGASKADSSKADSSKADSSKADSSKADSSKAGASKAANVLQKYFNLTDNNLEIGIDEAGRGPMLGRVYTAAVILPKDDSFNHSLMKDSKKFHSVKKIKEVAEYIKKNAVYWHVAYADERTIDEINILNATYKAMHEAIKAVIDKTQHQSFHLRQSFHLLVDGNNFKPFRVVNPDMSLEQIRHTCIEGGDNIYTAIAAASILAKVERDTYIEELCKTEPLLDERYGLLSNKGYGTRTHMDGIAQHGISQYHRKSFGVCKQYTF